MVNNEDNKNLDDEQIDESSSEEPIAESAPENTDEFPQFEDETNQEPSSMNETLAEEKPERPVRVLRKTIEDLFNDQDLRMFCLEHFEAVAKRVKATDDFDGIVLRLLEYCNTRYETDTFWKGIKADRPQAYDIWYKSWRKSFKYYENEQSTVDVEDELGVDFDSAVAKLHIDDEFHPLRKGNIDDITTWFFENLQKEEQSLALTIALFEGMQLNYIFELQSIMGKWLLGEENQDYNPAQVITDEKKDSANEIVFRVINGSVEQVGSVSQDEKPSSTYGDSISYEKIGIGIVTAKRNSFHGLTDVKTLSFGEGLDSALIIQLLDHPNLIAKGSHLLEIVRNLGISDEAERRLFAVLAVEKLANNQTFADLKVNIIDYWATHEDSRVRQNAARALSLLLEKDDISQEILLLLHHWITLPNNEFLSDVALSTYSIITRSHPYEVLRAVEVALDKRDFPLKKFIKMFRVIPIIDQVYALYPHVVIEHLYSWLENEHLLRREVAGVLFLSLVRFEDIIDDMDDISTENDTENDTKSTSDRVIKIIPKLWNNSIFSEQMTNKLYRWACTSLETIEDVENDIDDSGLQFFFSLHREYSGRSRNRLDIAIKKWQRKVRNQQSRTVRLDRKNNAKQTTQFLNFAKLIPSNL